MFRRLAATPARRLAPSATTASQTNALTVSRRNLEPMSTWYLASWTMVWYYAFYFWMPVLWTDIIVPTFVYNKLPLIHFLQEKRSEQKLRRVLDETYTQWSEELGQSHITDAIARAL